MTNRRQQRRNQSRHAGLPDQDPSPSADHPFKLRRILPAYQELLDAGALQGGTDSTQMICEDRDSRP
jgi:hypothetical protein